MVAVENIIVAAVTVIAFALTIIAILAWHRARDIHLLLLAGGFSLFFVKGVVLTTALFFTGLNLAELFIISGAFDLLILALFYGFTLRR